MITLICAEVEVLQTNDRTDNTEVVALILCDQSRVTAARSNDLVAAYHSTGMGIVASEHGGTFGVSALFGAKISSRLIRCSRKRTTCIN
jgi:molybdenum cofactor cytidylyltransferase